MNNEIKTSVVKIVEEATTESIDLGHGVEVVRITTARTGPKSGHKTETVFETVRHCQKTKDEYFGSFHIVEPSLLQTLAKQGWFRDDDEYKLLNLDKPFTRVLSGEPYEVVRVKNYDHTLYTIDGQYLPVAMHFNYIDGMVDNATFYMTGLVDHLKARDDVTLLQDRYAEEGKYIQNIPSYNRERGRNRFVGFVWHPDVETYRRFKAELDVGLGDSWARHKLAHTYMGNDEFRVERKNDDV